MASSCITSWQIDGEKVETVTDYLFFDSKITVDSDCSQEIKRCLLFWKESYDTVKSKAITLPTKDYIVRAMVFPVAVYWCENWTRKKTECWRTDAFKLWCWRIPLRVPWTSRRSNQSILKEIQSEYSLDGLRLKLQYFAHLMWRADLLEKTLMLGKIESRRRRGWQRMRWLNGIADTKKTSVWTNSGS